LGLVAIILIAVASAASSGPAPPPRPVVPVRPAGKQGWAPPPPPAERPLADFTLRGPREPIVLKRGETKAVVVTVDRAPGFAGRVRVRVDADGGLTRDRVEMVVEAHEQSASFNLSAPEGTLLGDRAVTLTGRSDDGRAVILELRVKVEP